MIKITPSMSFLAAGLLFLNSCVPMSKFNASQMALSSARYDSAQLANKVKDLQSQLTQLGADRQHQVDSLSQEIAALNQQGSALKQKNSALSSDAATRAAQLAKNKQDLADQ